MEPRAPELGVRGLNHWTTRGAPIVRLDLVLVLRTAKGHSSPEESPQSSRCPRPSYWIQVVILIESGADLIIEYEALDAVRSGISKIMKLGRSPLAAFSSSPRSWPRGPYLPPPWRGRSRHLCWTPLPAVFRGRPGRRGVRGADPGSTQRGKRAPCVRPEDEGSGWRRLRLASSSLAMLRSRGAALVLVQGGPALSSPLP